MKKSVGNSPNSVNPSDMALKSPFYRFSKRRSTVKLAGDWILILLLDRCIKRNRPFKSTKLIESAWGTYFYGLENVKDLEEKEIMKFYTYSKYN